MAATLTARRRAREREGPLRELHAQKVSVPEVARRLRCGEKYVRQTWKRMGLPFHGVNGLGVREKLRQGLRRRLNQEGFESSGDWSKFRTRAEALERGWPGATAAEADVLDAVAAGADSVPALVRATGKVRSTVYGTLSRLTRRGLLRKMDFFTWALVPRL